MSNMNQNHPFWDFVANMQQPGAEHPFANRSGEQNNGPSENPMNMQDFFGWGGPFGQMPHRGRHGPPAGRQHDNAPPAPPAAGPSQEAVNPPSRSPTPPTPPESVPDNEHEHWGPPPPFPIDHFGPGEHKRKGHHKEPGPHHGPPGRHGPHGRHGSPGPHGPHGRRGPPGPHGQRGGSPGPHHGPHGRHGSRAPHGREGGSPGPHHGPHGRHGSRGSHGQRDGSPGPHGRRGGSPGTHHGPHWRHGSFGPRDGPRGPRGGRCGRRGGWPHGFNGRGGAFPAFDPSTFDLNNIPAFLGSLFGPEAMNSYNTGNTRATGGGGDGTFQPAIDVFSTPTAYIVHASLPGAKKSDLDVSWNASTGSLHISGVTQRPREVDEELLSTMAVDERQVGLFERDVRLGDERVDEERISAKLEDGVLRIEVPKVEEWTEVRKVDVE